ncbi:MAG: DUF58 domain-containing protein [Azoarcus sp.]|jgi:uncharacterized protein (DUF58 family)|nr:DUF58 domain-containing protein [Azoarcus sp.]
MSPATTLDRLRAAFRWQWPRTPEAPPIRFAQHRIYVLPTLPGLAFAGALAVMLIASINYGLSLGYAFSFLLGGAAAASIVHAFRNLLHLSIRLGRVENTFCGGSAVFHLLIDNPTRRRPALHLFAGKAPGQRGETFFDMPPATSSEITLALPALRRGVLPLGRTIIETRWPLGLIRAWGVFMPEMTALVFPAPEPHPPPPPPGSGKTSAKGGAPRAGSEDFAGLRTYRDTDSPRHLAWKVFAQSGTMMTKQFSDVESGDLLLDWHALPAPLSTEARLSRLAAWLLRAEHAGQRYALRLPAHEFPASRGEAHLYRCLGALALHGFEAGKTWA